MLIPIDDYQWVNLDIDDVVSVLVDSTTDAEQKQKFYILVITTARTFETRPFDSEAEAVAQAKAIVAALNDIDN